MAVKSKTGPTAGDGGCSIDVVIGDSTELDFSSLLLLANTAMQEASLEPDDVTLEQPHQLEGDTENWKPHFDGDDETASGVRRSTRVSTCGKNRKTIAGGSPSKTSLEKQPSSKRTSGSGDGVPMTAMFGLPSADPNDVEDMDVQIAASPILGIQAKNMNMPKTMPIAKPAPKLKTASSRLGSRRATKTKRFGNPAKLLKDAMIGINFYKRIGKWTAHIWESSYKKQAYLGSYFTVTEAARAYDKAWLKIRAKNGRLNFQQADYRKDVREMVRRSSREYVKLLQKTAKQSKLPKATGFEGVHICPLGWYEVRLRNVASPKKLWMFLGRFRSLEDAKRCFKEASERMN